MRKGTGLGLAAGLFFIIVYLFAMPSSGQRVLAAEETFSMEEYEAYYERLEGIEDYSDIDRAGFDVIDSQIFPVTLEGFEEISFVPAFDRDYNRLALFFSDINGRIVYKTDLLETNSRKRGVLKQPNKGIDAVAFQDLNGDGRQDIILITKCTVQTQGNGDETCKVGDVLFQDDEGFYRDWRVSDKINRFGMNKSIEFIIAFVRDGYSTEFLYTATTLDELKEKGLVIIEEQFYTRQFEKLGTLRLVPGTYHMGDYQIFMIYFVNEQGMIVWSLQPMEKYDNLYALKGITCRDIDGDGLKDVVVLARYSYEGSQRQIIIKSDYEIYYQRTGGFVADTDFKKEYQCYDSDTMGELVEKARAYWGWSVDD